jgi:hypothetical protein
MLEFPPEPLEVPPALVELPPLLLVPPLLLDPPVPLGLPPTLLELPPLARPPLLALPPELAASSFSAAPPWDDASTPYLLEAPVSWLHAALPIETLASNNKNGFARHTIVMG